MGDRTSVTLDVPMFYKEAAMAIFVDNKPEDDFESEKGSIQHFRWNEVNDGTLDFLNDLRDAGIPYNSNWDAGHEYGAGTSSCRFTEDGDVVEKEIYDDAKNPELQNLLAMIDSPDELRKYILIYAEQVSTLPWDNQVEYSKRNRLKKLITAAEKL